jgi:hypothetical protein
MITSLHALAAILAMVLLAALRLRAQRDGPRRRLRPHAWPGPASQPSATATGAEAASRPGASILSPEVRLPKPPRDGLPRHQRKGLSRQAQHARARARPRWSRLSRTKIPIRPVVLEGKS